MADTGLGEYRKKRHHPDKEHLDTSIAKKKFSGQEFVDVVTRDTKTTLCRTHSADCSACLCGLYNRSKGALIRQEREYAMMHPETSFGSFCSTVEGCSSDASSICVSTEGVLSADFCDGKPSREKSKLLGTVYMKDSSLSRLGNTKTGKLDAERSEVTGIYSHTNSSLTYEDEFRDQSGIPRSVHTRIQVKRLLDLRPVPEDRTGNCASCSDRQQHDSFIAGSPLKVERGNDIGLLPIDDSYCKELGLQKYEPSIVVGDLCVHSFDSVGPSSKLIKGSCTCLKDEAIKGTSDVKSNDSWQSEAAGRSWPTYGIGNEMFPLSVETNPGPGSSKHVPQADVENIDTAEALSPSYVLSSGRLSLDEEAQLGRRTPTIDHDFEEYFSALML